MDEVLEKVVRYHCQAVALPPVVRYLDDHGDVGTVDEPGQYFHGVLPMAWGPVRTEDGEGLTYFGSPG